MDANGMGGGGDDDNHHPANSQDNKREESPPKNCGPCFRCGRLCTSWKSFLDHVDKCSGNAKSTDSVDEEALACNETSSIIATTQASMDTHKMGSNGSGDRDPANSRENKQEKSSLEHHGLKNCGPCFKCGKLCRSWKSFLAHIGKCPWDPESTASGVDEPTVGRRDAWSSEGMTRDSSHSSAKDPKLAADIITSKRERAANAQIAPDHRNPMETIAEVPLSGLQSPMLDVAFLLIDPRAMFLPSPTMRPRLHVCSICHKVFGTLRSLRSHRPWHFRQKGKSPSSKSSNGDQREALHLNFPTPADEQCRDMKEEKEASETAASRVGMNSQTVNDDKGDLKEKNLGNGSLKEDD